MLSALFSRTRRILSTSPFTKYLLLTNVVTGAFLDSLGDVVTQKKVERAEKNNWSRTERMGFMGFLLGVPYHYWYIYLDKWFPTRRLGHVGRKVALDIFISGPISISLFYLGMNRLEGKTGKEGCMELKQKFGVTFKLDLVVWLPFQIFNFYFLPLSLRLISANLVYFVWSMVLSYLKHNDINKSDQ